MNQSARAIPPTLQAHTLHIYFASHRNPGQKYKAVLDSFSRETFTAEAESSPAVGHMVLFTISHGAQEILEGTAKVHSVTALHEGKLQVEFKITQADPKSLEGLEQVFNERQDNILQWLSTFREE